MQGSYTTKSAAETIELGQKLGKSLSAGDIVLLYGDLGAGKTQLTKGIALGLGISETVVSPTFTIERIYQGKKLTLHHFDVYRTHEDREILEQITELTQSPVDVVVVEWPDNLNALTKFNHFEVRLEETEDDHRKIVFSQKGDTWS